MRHGCARLLYCSAQRTREGNYALSLLVHCSPLTGSLNTGIILSVSERLSLSKLFFYYYYLYFKWFILSRMKNITLTPPFIKEQHF